MVKGSYLWLDDNIEKKYKYIILMMKIKRNELYGTK